MRPMPPHRPLLALCAASLLVATAPALAAQQPIRWRSGTAALAPTDAPATFSVLESALHSGERHVVLQLKGRASQQVRQALAASGVTLSSALGGDAWFAAIEPLKLDAPRLAALPELYAVARIERAFKLHPGFAGGEAPAHARVGGTTEEPLVAAYAVFHPEVRVEGAVPRQLVLNQGGVVRDVLESVNALVIELPLARLGALADADAVQWIEPPLPRLSEVTLPNDSNRALVQADQVQAAPYGLDGSGVTVLVYDGGTALASHQDFGGRLTTHDFSGLISHATHVSGTIGGSGAASGGTFRGMAPAVLLRSFGFEYDGTGIFLYTNPGDLESDYDAALNTLGADVGNSSLGTNTEVNGFPCNIQGDYGVTESLIDAIVRGSLGAPFRIVWANGNERQGSGCDLEGFGDFYSTAPPATAKNHIAVGAVNSDDETMTTFSSFGPTDDGRLKPDVSAPGCQNTIDGGVTSTGAGGIASYEVMCGTSMAAPTVTGCVALLLEDFRAQFPGLPDPRNSTQKALLVQMAVDLGNPGPDYQFGFGSVRVKDTVDFQRLGRFDEKTIPDQGAAFVYSVAVAGGGPLKLTLAWDDVPGTPNVAGALVNDLDLVVVDPSGVQHHPWTLDPAHPSAPAVRTQADHVNNLEQVLVDSPLGGTWHVEVRGFDVPSGPQPFSLVSSHDLSVLPFLQIGFPDGLPATAAPGVATTIRARIHGFGETVVAGSPNLVYRLFPGPFHSLPLANVGPNLYEATLPPAFCVDTPEFYVSAAGSTSGATTNPGTAPAETFGLKVESTAVVFADNFETDKGWSVTSTSLADGPWQRAIPAGDGARNDPLADFDGSGTCFVTDNDPGNSDVDGGPTTVTSPLIDMSGPGTFHVRFAAWLGNDDFDADSLDVELSANGGGSWVPVMTFKNTSGWVLPEFEVADFATPSSTMRLRFSATDNPNDSVTEAALDAVEVVRVTCSPVLPPSVGTLYGAGSPGPFGVPTIAANGLLIPGTGFYLLGGNLPPGTPTMLGLSLHQLAPPVALPGGLVLNVNAPMLLLAPAVAGPGGIAAAFITMPPQTGGATVFAQCVALAGTGGNLFATSRGLSIPLP